MTIIGEPNSFEDFPLEQRVIRHAERLLAEHGKVSTLDLLLAVGAVRWSHITQWKRGLLPHLEQAISANPQLWADVMRYFHLWGESRGLHRELSSYHFRNRTGERFLRFTDTGDRIVESMYRMTYVSDDPPPAPEHEPDRVFWLRGEAKCARCRQWQAEGKPAKVNGGVVTCLRCAKLDGLEFLPAGDGLLTRLAREYSPRFAVVLRFSYAKDRYLREGVLVEGEAIARAKSELGLT
ncbi:MAG: hypothetical protein U0Q16_10965 [Bryobacteraceae bacterium]